MTEGGRRAVVLLVEDDPVISLDTGMTLEEMGAGVVEVAFTVEEAFDALDRITPDLVVLDIDLRGVVSFAFAERLAERGIPFVFTTGHGAEMPIPQALQAAPIIVKPYDPEHLREALARYLPTTDL